jgi:hypothetical protein
MHYDCLLMFKSRKKEGVIYPSQIIKPKSESLMSCMTKLGSYAPTIGWTQGDHVI